MAGFRIEGNTSGNLAEVDANNNLKVVTPTTITQAGYSALAGVVNDGTSGIARTVRRIEASDSFRLRAGIDSPLFFDSFAGSTINTSLWSQASTTMTIAVASGFLTLNASNITTTTTNAFVQSYRAFPLYEDAGLRCDFCWQISAVPTTNVTMEFGFGVGNSGTTVPTDGAFFRITNSGDLFAVVTNNTAETTTDLGFVAAANTRYEFSIVVDVNVVLFYVNNVVYALTNAGTTSSGTVAANEQRVFFRINNTGAAGTAVKMNVSSVSATLLDLGGNRYYRDALCGAGFNAIQGQTGFAAYTSTANYANSAVPATAALSNTAASYTTLGGQWQFAALGGAETDYALFAYQVPAGTAALPGKTLFVTGVHIDSVNTGAAVATTPTTLQWGLAVGATAVSLATAEGAAAKAPRRYALGVQSFAVGAAVGVAAPSIDVQFNSPLVVNQGEFFHVILKQPFGTATGSQIVRGVCMINGYFE